jgi:hypothetical protein
MSAQAYTNKRRILAEASLLKTVYPGRVGVKNTLAATIDCTQSFQSIEYTDICGCKFDGRGISLARPAIVVTFITGGNSTSNIPDILSGGFSSTQSFQIFSGGSS